MKKFLKIIKIIFTILFFSYSAGILFFFFFSPKETRFRFAEHAQGIYISQTLFNILKFQNPKYSDVYFEQSVAFNKRGDFAKGFQLLNKAVEIDPKLHLGYRGYMKLRFLRDYENALQDLQRLDTLTPNFVDAPWGEDINFLKGECYFGNRDYQKAIICFNQNIKDNKEDWVDVNTFVYLGLCEYELGNYEKAISEFNRALHHYDTTPEAHFGLAKTYLKLEHFKMANDHILEAEKNIAFKRNDAYNEFLNEIYVSEIIEFKEKLNYSVQDSI